MGKDKGYNCVHVANAVPSQNPAIGWLVLLISNSSNVSTIPLWDFYYAPKSWH